MTTGCSSTLIPLSSEFDSTHGLPHRHVQNPTVTTQPFIFNATQTFHILPTSLPYSYTTTSFNLNLKREKFQGEAEYQVDESDKKLLKNLFFIENDVTWNVKDDEADCNKK